MSDPAFLLTIHYPILTLFSLRRLQLQPGAPGAVFHTWGFDSFSDFLNYA
jgi:hypothetical protein